MEAISLIKNHNIVIWGGRERGRVIFELLNGCYDMHVAAFVDSDTRLIGLEIENTQIFSKEEFIRLYNDEGTTVIIGGYNPISAEEITGYLCKHDFKGAVIGCYEFHHSVELPVLLNRKSQKNIDYEKKISQWSKSFLAEAGFWKTEAISASGTYHDEYLLRVDDSKEFVCERARDFIKEGCVVLDVGCGISSNYGHFIDGKPFTLIGIDPLAAFYNRLNQNAYERGLTNGKAPATIRFGMFEMLSSSVEKDSCDVVLIDNAIDHCIDPLCAIIECLDVLKVGGVLSTFHHLNEAYRNYYHDMHQWNICMDNKGHFILWNKESFIDVNDELGDYADISVQLVDIRRIDVPFGGIICNIKKKKDIPGGLMDASTERQGLLTKALMERLADPVAACDYMRFCLE